MQQLTPSPRGNILSFPKRQQAAHCLTQRDRQEVAGLRMQANEAGYDALMIHVVPTDEGCGTTDYVAAYRAGEPWSSWCFARSNGSVCAWNALTSRDAGNFSCMSEALSCILLGTALPRSEVLPTLSGSLAKT